MTKYLRIYAFLILIGLIIGFIFVCSAPGAKAGNRFTSSYSCVDSGKSCISSGTRTVEGFQVHRDCWEWAYSKQCNYPSKNNCAAFGHCYLVALRECLLTDSIGNCVNQVKEYSCKRWQPNTVNKDKVRYGKEDREGEEQLICKGIPCIDGNCIDKSFDSNNEMMDSVSRLYAVSEMKGAGDPNIKLFAGYPSHCSKKAADYSNCCSLTGGGNNWGHNIGARCTQDEKTLVEQRKKNLCVYVGKENKQTLGVQTVVKHHWCCFGNMLTKVIQVEGRKQLGMNFGTAKSPNCRGLTLEEMLRLDFDRMDFSEFEAEILKKMRLPKTGDMQARIQSSMPSIQKPKGERMISDNKRDGFNVGIQDDSWEAEEEKRKEEERLALERQRQEEERRRQLALEQERQRQIALEQERQRQLTIEQERKRQEEAKRQRRLAKERELGEATREHEKAQYQWNSWVNSVWYGGGGATLSDYEREHNKFKSVSDKKIRIESELRSGNY